jgi:predicted amidohydrolase YtcJ
MVSSVRRAIVFLTFSLLATGCATTSPDLVLVNGKVFTADEARPWAEAVAVRGERIEAVGTSETIRALAGSRTRVVDLAGRLVVPGINDAHVHEPWGWDAKNVEVSPTSAADDVLSAIREVVKTVPPGNWIRAELTFELADDAKLTRNALDTVAPDHPVWLTNPAGHSYLLNTAAIRRFGIGERDADPPGGRYGRTDGLINGWLYEHAVWAKSFAQTEARSDEDLLAAMRAFSDEALRYGITSVQTMPGISAERIRRLSALSTVPIRWRWMELRMASVNDDPTMPVKYILDGTPIERGAALRRSYADRPDERGYVNYTDDQLRQIVAVAGQGRQPVLVHISGDLAIEKLFAEMRRSTVDWKSKRVRIEHGDFVGPFIAEAKRLGVVVVQNPSHLMLPAIMNARFGGVGPDYQVLRSLLEAGVPLALGSDGPLNPWLNVMFATIHATNPAEALTREQAVAAYTRGAAYAEFAENDKGTITPGKLADLAVLSQDVFTVPAPALPATESVMTIVGGKIVRNVMSAPAP